MDGTRTLTILFQCARLTITVEITSQTSEITTLVCFVLPRVSVYTDVRAALGHDKAQNIIDQITAAYESSGGPPPGGFGFGPQHLGPPPQFGGPMPPMGGLLRSEVRIELDAVHVQC